MSRLDIGPIGETVRFVSQLRELEAFLHRDAYVMSLDVAGLFRDVGEDEKKGGKYRFALAATYVFPKTTGVPEDASCA